MICACNAAIPVASTVARAILSFCTTEEYLPVECLYQGYALRTLYIRLS